MRPRTSTASCRGWTSTRASSTRRATSATRSWSGRSSWPSSPRTSTSSSRSASPACWSRWPPASAKRSPDGRTAAEQLAAIRDRVHGLVAEHARLYGRGAGRRSPRRAWRSSTTPRSRSTTPASASATSRRSSRSSRRSRWRPGHPFPYISTLSLSLAVAVARSRSTGEQRFARVKVPPILPRLVAGRTPHVYVPLEQVIAANLDALFPGMEIVEAHLFRVTRDADFDVEEDEAGDLLSAIEHELRRRRFGSAVRLEVEDGMPDDDPRVPPRRASASGRTTCYAVAGHARPHLPVAARRPSTSRSCATRPGRRSSRPASSPPDEGDAADVFAAIRQGDILVHHPYESFTRIGGAVHRPGRRRPRRPDDQA